MAEKKEIMTALRELKEKRLLSSEAEELMKPYEGATFDLRLDFVSSSRSFGSQKDPLYDSGQKVLCTAEKWDVECDVLFSPEDNDLVESLEVGQDFQVTVKFIDYDSLYQRVIFGKVGSELELLEELGEVSDEPITNDLVVEEETVEVSVETILEENDSDSVINEIVEEVPQEPVVEEIIESDSVVEEISPPAQENVQVEAPVDLTVASNFSVGIDEKPNNKVAAIAALRNVRQGISLQEAKQIIEDPPFVIKSNCTEEEAKEIQAKFRRVGANIFYATNDIWENIIADKNASLVESPVVKSTGPTFGGDQTDVQSPSYIQTPSNNQSPPSLPSNNQSPPPLPDNTPVKASAPVSEEKTNNCGAGCAALFFYGIGGFVTLLSFDEGGFGAFIMGLILIGIGYGIQKASSTK
ncbi:MAG: ribosomal protein L7/L12 [Verrucomicrobiales bacterium]